MNAPGTILEALLPVFMLMLAGFVLRRVRWLTEEADQSLLKICVNVLLPCLIFESVLGNPALHRPENLLWPPLVGIALVLVSIGIAAGVARLVRIEGPAERRTFALTTGLQNYGYVPLPLCILLFDPGTVGVLLVHNVGVELVLWTVGVAVLSGRGFRGGWRKVINAPLIALALALLLNAGASLFQITVAPHVGTVPMTAIHWLGQCAIPLALLLIGATVADHFSEIRGGHALRVVTAAIIVRLAIMPILFVAAARWLPCSIELKRVLIVEGAMAAAVLPIALSKHYGGDPRTALQVVLSTSCAGLVTIPLWIQFGGKLAGLW